MSKGIVKILSDLIADLEARAVNGEVNCSHGVYMAAKEAVAGLEPNAVNANGYMTDTEVWRWIDACKHQPAKDVLKDYLSLRQVYKEPGENEKSPTVKPLDWQRNRSLYMSWHCKTTFGEYHVWTGPQKADGSRDSYWRMTGKDGEMKGVCSNTDESLAAVQSEHNARVLAELVQ